MVLLGLDDKLVYIVDKVFTCTVGQKPSKAEFYVDDYTDVIALLKSLKVVSTKVRSLLYKPTSTVMC